MNDLQLGLHRPAPDGRAARRRSGRFLNHCRASYAGDGSGAVADYIPELSKADPAQFGIGLATIDGHVYEVGDSQIEFTIQSISKPFVYALALEDSRACGGRAAKIGVEPSGDAVQLDQPRPRHRRPFNPMVNAGAIASAALVAARAAEARLDAPARHASALSPAGRSTIDEAVYRSERATGHRNRAIAYLLRNFGIVEASAEEALDALLPPVLDPGQLPRPRGHGGDAGQRRRQSGHRRARAARRACRATCSAS